MLHLRWHTGMRRLVIIALVILTGEACDRGVPAHREDSATSTQPSYTQAVPQEVAESSWLAGVGSAMFIEGSSPSEAIVVGPMEGEELAAAVRATVTTTPEITLLGRGGQQSVAHLNPSPDKQDPECMLWSFSDHGAAASNGWAVGFVTSQVKPLALDSVDVLSARDSMTLVAEVSRLASAVTGASGPAFQGLRFTAHDIRRFEAVPGQQALVAHVIRRVNQEASPLEEQTLLIAERDSGVTSGPYHLVYAERSSGLEDQATTPEVIGGAIVGRRTLLVVARDSDTGISYSVLERLNAHEWRVRWTSKPTACS